jgi:hypothetical protein
MDIAKALIAENSKAQVTRIVNYIGNDEKKFAKLIHLVLKGDEIIKQRAAWVMSYCIINYPYLAIPHLNNLIDLLEKPVHNALKRNVVRFLQFIDISEEHQGKIFDICIKLLLNNNEAIAVHAFAMSVCANICKKHPELKHELKLIINEMIQQGSPAIKARGKHILKELN